MSGRKVEQSESFRQGVGDSVANTKPLKGFEKRNDVIWPSQESSQPEVGHWRGEGRRSEQLMNKSGPGRGSDGTCFAFRECEIQELTSAGWMEPYLIILWLRYWVPFAKILFKICFIYF